MSASLIGRLGSSAFRVSTHSSVDVAHGLALLFGLGTKALPSWDSKTRRNNLWRDLAVEVTAGSSGHTNSPHPSSREGHHSTVGWSSKAGYIDARPHIRQLDESPLATHAGPYMGVKTGTARSEHIPSECAAGADIIAAFRHLRVGPLCGLRSDVLCRHRGMLMCCPQSQLRKLASLTSVYPQVAQCTPFDSI